MKRQITPVKNITNMSLAFVFLNWANSINSVDLIQRYIYTSFIHIYMVDMFTLATLFFWNLKSSLEILHPWQQAVIDKGNTFSENHCANTADMELLDPISFCLHKLFIEQQSTMYFPL